MSTQTQRASITSALFMNPQSIALFLSIFAILQLCASSALAAAAPSAAQTQRSPAAKTPVAKTRQAPAERPAFGKLLAEHAGAIVQVKYVLRIKGPKGPDRSSDAEASGVMIDPSGLLLVSNANLGMSELMRRMGSSQGLSANATELRVLIGDDTEGLPAQLVARDTELDLSWVKIDDPKERKFEALDLSASAEPQPGDTLVLLSRTAQFLGHAPVAVEAQVAGRTDRPHPLILVDGTGGLHGAPAFTLAGKLAGVSVLQFPDEESHLHSTAPSPGMILTAEELRRATARAKEQASRTAAHEASERAEEKKLESSGAGAAAPPDAGPGR